MKGLSADAGKIIDITIADETSPVDYYGQKPYDNVYALILYMFMPVNYPQSLPIDAAAFSISIRSY